MKTGHFALGWIFSMLLAGVVQAQVRDVPHPFLLWTKDDAAAIRKRIETDPIAKQQLAIMVKRDSQPVGKGGQGNPNLLHLFQYLVLDDQKAGEAEKKELLTFIGKVPEPMTDEFKASWAARIKEAGSEDATWQRGMASFADRHMRDEQTLNALRYDVLYDMLAPEERAGVEKSMRAYIQFHLDGHKPWHPDFKYSKAGWLPNMSWPRAIGTHVMAAALHDEKLIAAMFNGVGGYKWYMDEYISDGHFYCEEFNKYYSNIGTMLIWCESMEHLGLPQYGYGYTGKGGASMKSFLEMPMWIGYPRTDIPGGMPIFRIVTMGDAKGSPFGITGLGDSTSVNGYLPDAKTNGNSWWQNSNMNGPFVKWREPMWFELGQKRFPDSGFGYFLAALRKPGEDVYLPSLYFNLGPVDPKVQRAPAAPSYFAFQRGFAFLRADESPAYWDSPAPAVAMQTGFYYPHYAHDCFSLLGYHAFNRTIYANGGGGEVNHYVIDQIKNGPPTGYVGRHPWKDTNRGHAGVTVDNLGPRPTENGDEGLKHHVIRSGFSPSVKFVAARTKGVFPNVTQERALFLTHEYLFDVFWVADSANQPRRYEWNINAPGAWQYTEAWKSTSELNGSMLYRPLDGDDSKQPAGYESKLDGNDLADVHKLVADNAAWTATILQTCALPDMAGSKLGPAFYGRKIGVNISMLPEKGTIAYAGKPPGWNGELGGAALIVRRETPATTFVALHVPFENNQPRPLTLTRIAQTESAVATRVFGPGVDDRVLLVYGDKPQERTTLDGAGESFTFTSYAHVRITSEAVIVTGELTALTLKVSGNPKLVMNGKDTLAPVSGGVLTFQAK